MLRDVRGELRRDRTFLLLHYRWDGSRLWPCGPPPDGGGGHCQGGDQPPAGQNPGGSGDGGVAVAAAGGPEGSGDATAAGPAGREQGQQPEEQQSEACAEQGPNPADQSRGERKLPVVEPGGGDSAAGLVVSREEAVGAAQVQPAVPEGAGQEAVQQDVRQRQYTVLDSNVQVRSKD